VDGTPDDNAPNSAGSTDAHPYPLAYPSPQRGYGYPPYGNWYPPPSPPPGLAYLPYAGWVRVASVWRRFLARLIDVVITSTFAVLCIMLAFTGMPRVLCTDGRCAIYSAFLFFFAAVITAAAAGFVYEWLMIGLKGQTLGKMALGVKVLRSDTAHTPGLGKGAGRVAMLQGCALVPYVGGVLELLLFISVFFDRTGRRQTWYDQAAGTIVIAAR
jgi:uncharacterized RDD family membrane protein YckC